MAPQLNAKKKKENSKPWNVLFAFRISEAVGYAAAIDLSDYAGMYNVPDMRNAPDQSAILTLQGVSSVPSAQPGCCGCNMMWCECKAAIMNFICSALTSIRHGEWRPNSI